MKLKNIWLKSSLLLSPLSLSTLALANIDSTASKMGQEVQKAGKALERSHPSRAFESLQAPKFHQKIGILKSAMSYKLGRYASSKLDLFLTFGHDVSAKTNQYPGTSFPLQYLPSGVEKIGGSANLSINGRYLFDANLAGALSLGVKGGGLSRSSNDFKSGLAANGLFAAEVRYGECIGSGSLDFTLASCFSKKTDSSSSKPTSSTEGFKLLEGARGFEFRFRTPSFFKKLLKIDVNFGDTNRFSKLGTDTTAALPWRWHVEALVDVINLVRGYLPTGCEHFFELKVGVRALTNAASSTAWSAQENLAPAFALNFGDFRAKAFEHNARLAFENSASLLKNDLLETSWTRLAQVPSSSSNSNLTGAAAAAGEAVVSGAEAFQEITA